MPQESTVRVQLGSRGYDVVAGPGLLFQLGERARALFPAAQRAFIVSDLRLPGSRLAIAVSSLDRARFAAAHTLVKASEKDKSLRTVEQVLTAMAQARLERSDIVVALGGGVVGDVAGFAATVYRRGIAFIQCPTTLLAMVDASVGGKTGVNLDLGTPPASDIKKNAVGSFHQPSLVLADTDSLITLPERHLRAGLAECIKHGLIGAHADDVDLLVWTTGQLDSLLALDKEALAALVLRNVAIKARIVEGDEREEAEDALGGRALLNLGHTFAHAIEPLERLSPDGNAANAPLLHGEAVGLGLIAASACSVAIQAAPAGLMDLVRDVIRRAGLSTAVAGLPDEDRLIDLMGHDKKARSGHLRLVLPIGDARARVVTDPPRDAIVAGWRAIRAM